jgi:hypothetical protein
MLRHLFLSSISLRKEVSKRSESPTLLRTFPLSLIRTTVIKHGLTPSRHVFLFYQSQGDIGFIIVVSVVIGIPPLIR